MEKSCLFPNCEEIIKTRGLCALHYQYAYRLVKRSHTTWEELETQGKAKPRTRISSDVNKWFLDDPDQRLLEKEE
jgi:hypothetical protein